MASLNKVFLIGNLTKDPELRYTPNGIAVATLRVAVSRKYKDRTGEMKEDTCFLNVNVWEKQAEVCNQYLQKGRPVMIEGRLQSRSWETADGQKRNTIDVRAERVQFLGSANKEPAMAAKTVDHEEAAPAAAGEPAGGEVKSESAAWDEEEQTG